MRDRGKRRLAFVFLVIVGFLALGVGLVLVLHPFDVPHVRPAIAITNPTPSPPTNGGCHSVNGLADPTCTPGVADPRVTQDDIHTTICFPGYTASVRPSSTYTDTLKALQIKAYGYADTNLAGYEEDHLIPLELGGNPTDPKNLWPEPRSGAYSAAMKDGVENSLHRRVCAGLLTMAAAQAGIAKDWESFLQQ
jgi:hypothetical protein